MRRAAAVTTFADEIRAGLAQADLILKTHRADRQDWNAAKASARAMLERLPELEEWDRVAALALLDRRDDFTIADFPPRLRASLVVLVAMLGAGLAPASAIRLALLGAWLASRVYEEERR